VGLHRVEVRLVGLRSGRDTGVVDCTDAVGVGLVVLDDVRVTPDVVGVGVGRDEVIDSGDVARPEVVEDVLAVVLPVTGVVQHGFACRADDEDARPLSDVDEVDREVARRPVHEGLGVRE